MDRQEQMGQCPRHANGCAGEAVSRRDEGGGTADSRQPPLPLSCAIPRAAGGCSHPRPLMMQHGEDGRGTSSALRRVLHTSICCW
uniref:Uncharacterized protein n=1 Tax=Globodera rostochiensis TaxID=31243 RepID=A0A914GRF1_GLORO